MFDYLNEFLLLYKGLKNGSTYKDALALKNSGDAYLFNLLCREWKSRYKWSCSEKSIATELIERTILYNGICGIAKFMPRTKDRGELDAYIDSWRCFRVTGTDNLSFYGYPNTATLTSYNGLYAYRYLPVHDEEESDIANCVLIYDNFEKYSPINTILYFAKKLSIINTSINACIKNILGTSVITGSQEQIKEIRKQRKGAEIGLPFLIAVDELASVRGVPESTLISTKGAGEELVVLYEAFDKTHGDFLQSIGIRSNSEMNKKSGVTPMEVVENRQNVDLILNDGLKARQKACEQCKRIGLNSLSVTLDNFESLVSDYTDDGERTNNVDPIASEREEGDGDVSD